MSIEDSSLAIMAMCIFVTYVQTTTLYANTENKGAYCNCCIGAPGPSGPQGISGMPGMRGLNGFKGQKGENGNSGSMGN